MRVFFLDLASHLGLLACVEEDAVRAAVSLDHRIADHELLPLVEKLLREAQWRYEDLTHIACVAGPGGFTSLRVAVALANTLMHELKIPGAGIHLSDLYASRIASSFELRASSFLWLHSTKKHELFVRGFGSLSRAWPEPMCIAIDQLLTSHFPLPTSHYVGELLPEHEKLLHDQGAVPAPLLPLQEVLPAFLCTQEFGHELLRPWYGRGG